MRIRYYCSDYTITTAVIHALLQGEQQQFEVIKLQSGWNVDVRSITTELHERVRLYSPGATWETL